MQIHKLRELVQFDDNRFLPKVLMNRPGYRLVLLNLRKGQSVPAHSNDNVVTVYALSGHITFYENDTPGELHEGEVLQIEPGAQHHLEAHEDSSVLVIAAGGAGAQEKKEFQRLDLRRVPRPERHPMVFGTFDSIAVGDFFEIINDHDPVPLHRQVDEMRPGQAEWTYIERGPEVYHIRVRRIAPLSGPPAPKPVNPDALLGISR